jgi:hypothetical protein
MVVSADTASASPMRIAVFVFIVRFVFQFRFHRRGAGASLGADSAPNAPVSEIKRRPPRKASVWKAAENC